MLQLIGLAQDVCAYVHMRSAPGETWESGRKLTHTRMCMDMVVSSVAQHAMNSDASLAGRLLPLQGFPSVEFVSQELDFAGRTSPHHMPPDVMAQQ